MLNEEKPKRKNDSLDRWTMGILAVIAVITFILFLLFMCRYVVVIIY